jgi:hypothetical protein
VLAVVAAVKQAANPVIARRQSLNDLPRLVSTAILNDNNLILSVYMLEYLP